MLIIFIIFLVILLILAFLLFMRIVFLIDSDEDKYLIKAGGIINLDFYPDNELGSVRFKFLFFRKEINLADINKKRRSPNKLAEKKKEKNKSPKGSGRINAYNIRDILELLLKAIKRLTGKFRIKYMDIDFDTNNFFVNGNLIPLFSYLSTEKINICINFTGRRFISTSFYFRIGSLIPVIAGSYFRVRKYLK